MTCVTHLRLVAISEECTPEVRAGAIRTRLRLHHPRHLLPHAPRHGQPGRRRDGRSTQLAPRCCTVAAPRPRCDVGAFSPLTHFTCKYKTFRSGRCWVRTSDLLLVREVRRVHRGPPTFRNPHKQAAFVLDERRRTCPYPLALVYNWCTSVAPGRIRTCDRQIRRPN